jgi:DNA-directed RNA polymerase
MTSVYGITSYTARNHLITYLSHEQDSETEGTTFLSLSKDRLHEAAQYLTEKIFESLYSSLFQRAKLIQNWLTAVATEIGRAVPPPTINNATSTRAYPETFLTWTTPLGFQVTQPYVVQPPTVQYRTGQMNKNNP